MMRRRQLTYRMPHEDDLRRDVREARTAQERYRPRLREPVEEITRLCCVCGIPFLAGWSHAPLLLATKCLECAE